jgi:hypothetical protein
MAFYYLKEDDLDISDPVCLVPGEPGRVKKATPEALLAARAVLGVVLKILDPDPEDETRRVIRVGDAGNIPAVSWNAPLADGTPRITGEGTLLVARDGSCARVVTPLSGDYVIGIVQEDGTLVIQRDYELSLATHRMVNVRDFGATGDGITDDSPAFEAALAALPPYPLPSMGTVVFIPPGEYRMTRDLEIKREVHLLGAGGGAGNAGVKLIFDPGYGIVVHSHLSTPQLGQFGAGSVIEGLYIIGTPPGALRGAAYTDSFPTRWQPNTDYEVGSRVFMFRADPLEWKAGQPYRAENRERKRPADRIRPPGRFDVVFEAHPTSTPSPMDDSILTSGEVVPNWDSRLDIPGVGLAVPDNDIYWVEPDGVQEWQPDHPYVAGQKIRPPGRCNVIFKLESSGSSGVGPDWNIMTYVNNVGWIVTEEDTGIRWVRQDDTLIDIQGYRDFYWECVRPGRSGPVTPPIGAVIAGYKSLFAADKASIIDLSSQWLPGNDYHEGQVIHPPGRFNVVFVFLRTDEYPGSPYGTSSDRLDEPDWDAGAVILDNGITWFRQDASPYFYDEGSEGPIWRARVHAGIRIHTACSVRRCFVEGFLNAGIWICADGGYFPGGNAIGWNVQETGINLCGTGIFVRGNMAHQGTATNVQCVQIGQLPNMIGGRSAPGSRPPEWLGIDWRLERDQGGNGGISFFDLSYFGNEWTSCTNEFALDRALVMEGTSNQVGIVTKFWDEGTGSRRGAYLYGSSILIGGLFNSGIDPRTIPARVGVKEFRQVEEVNESTPRQTRAMLHRQGKGDAVFLWTANRAAGNSYSNTIGWRLQETGYPNPPSADHTFDPLHPFTFPNPKEWSLSYQESYTVSYLTVQDGFGPLSVAWREPSGHFRGGWAGGRDEAYYLGVSTHSERDKNVRRAFRQTGDRFEPPLWSGPGTSLRGRFLGRIVSEDGFRGSEGWQANTDYWAFQHESGLPPFTIEADGFVFICTRRGLSGRTPPNFSAAIRGRTAPSALPLSPIFSKGLILSSWIPSTIQQVGIIKRPNRRNPDDNHYYLYVCTHLEGSGATGAVEPDWYEGDDEIIETVWNNDDKSMTSRVTWKRLGVDPDDACVINENDDPTTGLQWTCVGRVASFAEYGPVYEQGEAVANHGDDILLDEYPVNSFTCAQFDIVVTAMEFGSTHNLAAAFTLRAAYFSNGSRLVRIGEDEVDRRISEDPRRVTDDSMNARLETVGNSLRLYVRGVEGVALHWRSLRRPHKDAEQLS